MAVATTLLEANELLSKAGEYLPPDRIILLKEAYEFAAKCHDGQYRESGDPFIQHPLHTAMLVANLGLDAAAITAALLHDVEEDCDVPNLEIEKRFGAEVARLVEGATKLSKLTLPSGNGRPSDHHMQAENLRKMFVAMAEDLRVVIIKLADRLHNMRTLEYLRPEDRVRIAQETIEIYAPLAGRLGIFQFKWELEDLSFRHLQPDRYREVAQLLATKRQARERYIHQVERIVRDELDKQGIKAEVQGRAKHLYSIYQKMERYADQGKSFDQIYDLLALRVLVDTVSDCYSALGVIHNLWKPLPGQFDDYIANPKGGVYQSLHTSVLSSRGRPLEVQIRTHEMHRVAEYGIAAHWRYKEGGAGDLHFEERLAWLRQLLEWQRETAEDFVEALKTDIFPDQVFVFTPKGEVKDLPAGATPIDFAYRVHTDVGHRCIGAKVNGRLVPLNHQLQNGDVVEILTSRATRGPSRDWLNTNLGYARTSHAREKIRLWFKRQERQENIERGQEMLEKELRRLGTSFSEHKDDILRLFGYSDADSFLATVGYGDITTHQVALRLAPLLQPSEEMTQPSQVPVATPRISPSIQVLGTGDLLTNLARCCNPVPGDEIVGYVTRSRGVTVHREDCPNILKEEEKERMVEVSWGHAGQFYPVGVRIEAWDRVGLLRDVSTVVATEHVNMVGVRTQEHPDRTISIFVTLETTGLAQLTRLLGKLETVRGVLGVSRWDSGPREG